MKKFLFTLALLMLISSAKEAAAEDSWRLTTYKSFTFNPKSGRLSIYGEAAGSYAVKLEVNLPEGKAVDYCTIRVLIVYGTNTQFVRNTNWEASVDLLDYRPPFPDHILERIRNTGFRPPQPPLTHLLKKYKGVAIESVQWIGRGSDKKLKRSITRIDFARTQEKDKK